VTFGFPLEAAFLAGELMGDFPLEETTAEPPEIFEVTIGLLTTFLESTREEVRTDVRSGEDFGLEKERSFSLEGHKRGDKEGSGT
jgi:hypothetical protein